MTLSANANPHASIESASGIVIAPPLSTSAGAASMNDTNGNEISTDGTTFTDTLGVAALSISGTNPVAYSYPNFSGGTSQVTVNYTTKTVQTNFGCSGISEYGPYSESLISSISLPNGTSYSFTYESTPNGQPGAVTGRIASVTLPTGGVITYDYNNGVNDGINCSDGTTAYLKRITPDGTWTYTHSETGSAWTTTVIDPQGNKTAYQFQETYETERQIYQGTNTVLKTVYTCYNGASAPCNNMGITLPITQQAVTAVRDDNLESETVTDYNSYGLPTEVDEYGYDTGAPGALARKTVTSYDTLAMGIFNFYRPGSVSIYDGGNNLKAETTFAYDQTGLTATSGTPQFLDPTGSRGNLTTLTESVSGSATISRTFSYYDTGNIYTATDFNGNATTITYGDCGNSLPTQFAPPAPNGVTLDHTMAWDCNTGLLHTAADPNQSQNPTTFNYDAMSRPLTTAYPDGGAVSMTYNDTANPVNVVTTTALGAPGNRVDTEVLDGLGRVTQTQLNSDPAGPDYVDTTYDSLGRVASVSNPYRSTSDPAYGITRYTYDALNRPTVTTEQDNNTVQASYGSGSQWCSSATYGLGYPTLSTNEFGWIRRTWTDALGRLIEVDETDPGNGGEADQPTCYNYDALGNLTQVAEYDPSSGHTQYRTYNYDMLSRLTSDNLPESGTTYFYYTASGGGLCSGDPSKVCSRTDARGTTTTYTYDALNRLTSKSYTNDPSNMPAASFYYDGNWAGIDAWRINGLTNTAGRLMATCTSSQALNCSSSSTATIYSYDPMGRVIGYWQCTPYNCSTGPWAMSYTYDLAGDISTWTHPAGFTITNSINGAQETTQITSSLNDSTHPGTLAAITYTPWGAEQSLENGCAGSGCTNAVETYAYNNRLQPVMIELGTPSNASADYCLVYNYYWGEGTPSSCSMPGQGGVNNGNLLGYFYQDSVNPSLSHTASLHNDGLNRLYEAQATGSSTYFFDYTNDRYGNMTCTINGNTNGYCPEYSFDPNTNRITNSGFSYDAAGDLTSDGAHTYQWDADGHMISEDGHQSSYNAVGQRVEYNTAAYPVEQIYDAAGQQIGTYSSSGYNNGGVPYWWGADVRFGGHILAYDICCGYREVFLHRNLLGSVTMPMDYAGNPLDDLLLYPWGGYWTDRGQIQTQQYAGFEGMDASEGFYPAAARMYEPSYSRWLSPDPLGGNVANPQSLNRYAYALNNPTTLTDPSGMGDCNPNHDPDCTGGNDNGKMDCRMDGLVTPCSVVTGALRSGFALLCNGPCPSGPPINVTGWLYGNHVNVNFDNWDQYADWRTTLASSPADQVYEGFWALLENNGLDPNAPYPVSVFLNGPTYNVQLPGIPLNTAAAAQGRIPDPYHGVHKGNSWYGLSPVDTLHLVDDPNGAEAHFDWFNAIELFPLHELFDYLPSLIINPKSQIPQHTSNWWCSGVGGCHQ